MSILASNAVVRTAFRSTSTNCSEEEELHYVHSVVATRSSACYHTQTPFDVIVRKTDMTAAMCDETLRLFCEAFGKHSSCNESVSRVVKEALDKK